MNFVVLWPFVKVFAAKFGDVHAWRFLAWNKQTIRESFLHENRIFRQFVQVFFLKSFLHMWQSWVETELYSVAYFDRITTFKAL